MSSRHSSNSGVGNGVGVSLGRRSTAASTSATSAAPSRSGGRGGKSPSPSASQSASRTVSPQTPSQSPSMKSAKSPQTPSQSPSMISAKSPQTPSQSPSMISAKSPRPSLSGRSPASSWRAGGGARTYAKSYCSWRDESIAGESAISLGSIDENQEFAIPEELVRSIGMDCYSVEEKVQLDNLLQRLLVARRQDERRREKLRRELHRTMAQVSQVQNRGDQPGLLYSLCELCGARLYFVHRRYVCNRCAYLACRSCVYLVHGAEPQCRLCRLEVLNAAKTGEWFDEEARQRAGGQGVLTGPEILLASLSRERQRLVLEERQRREQKKAEQEDRQRIQQAAEQQQRPDKKGRKEHKGDKKAAAAAAAAAGAASTSHRGQQQQQQQQHQQQQQALVSIRVEGPDDDVEIAPDDSVSVAGRNFDVQDGDILIEQAMQAGAFRRGSQESLRTEDQQRQQQQHRPSNLISMDATSRESLASNVSETEASYVHGLVPSGEVEVNLQYNYKERRFTVNVVQCRNLNALDGNPPNPYVKTYLLPDKTKRSKRRTQTRRATANPIYSEQLVYDIVKSELETRTLQVSVWHSLTFGSNVFLGECRVPMENYRFDAGPEVLKLGRRVEVPVPLPTLMYRGDIMLALRFVGSELIRSNQLARDDPTKAEGHGPAKGRLEVWVQNCRNLAGSGGGASPYVKGYLINPENIGRGGRNSRDSRTKQKSAIVKGDMNPNFNSILAFENVSLGDLNKRSLELTVWDYVKIGRNDFLGGVRLNVGDGHHPCMDARGHEMLMWTRMLEKPNDWVEGSLLLRPSMDPRMDNPQLQLQQ